MADENKTQAQAAADAPAKVAATVADAADKLIKASVKTEKTVRARVARKAKRSATSGKTTARRAKAPRRNTRTAARKTAAVTQERINEVTFNPNRFFTPFNGAPAFAPFQSLFADAGERGQEVARRSQQVAEELADMTRENVEAIVEAGRLAAEGARSIGQDVIARSRGGVEQTADAIRSLAEAKSPTEFVQLQSELVRSSFDRMVAESSRLTESMVKLAGEAFQPLSNRASANAERINTFVA